VPDVPALSISNFLSIEEIAAINLEIKPATVMGYKEVVVS
jgi:hypothetical protein